MDYNERLLRSAMYGDCDGVINALNNGADVDTKDENKRTALIWAIWKGHKTIVFTLIEAGANLDIQNDYGKAPLHWAVRKGDIDIVHRLLDAGADLSIKTSQGKTPLDMAIAKHYDNISCLIKSYLKKHMEQQEHCSFDLNI